MRIPTVRCIGWDFAHTDRGWVVIEGNDRCQLIGAQMTREHGLKKEFEDMVRKTGVKF